MAAGAFKFYDKALLAIANGTINLNTNTLVMVLCGTGYTPNKALDDTYSDLSAHIITDPDYAPVVISGKTFTIPSGDEVLFDANDVSFGSPVTISAKWAPIVVRAGGALSAGDLLLGYVDLNTASGSAVLSSTAGAFTVRTPNGFVGFNNAD
jgi:hypothetical protein